MLDARKDKNMLESFAPLINHNTRIMILGTMPGVKSLAEQQYYAHPQNAFWKIISQIYHQGKPFENYEEKKQCLLAHNIGLWDNLRSCLREGSLDTNITDAIPNDFETLFSQYPNVSKLLFNGQASFKYFKKYHPLLLSKTAYEIMPSTSPANASVRFEQKLDIWKNALKKVPQD